MNLGRLNLDDDDDEAGGGGKNCGEYGSGSAKSGIRGDGRSSVAVLRCMDAGSSNMWENGRPLREVSGARVRTELATKAREGKSVGSPGGGSRQKDAGTPT